jgi:hypothetical protein
MSIHDMPTIIPGAPREPSLLPPARTSVSLGDLICHQGPLCESCDHEGQLTGCDASMRAGRVLYPSCPDCTERGDRESRGQVCPGLPGEGCSDGPYPPRLAYGGYELPSGRCVCRACAAVAVGHRGYGDAADVAIEGALDALEGGAQ